MKAVFAIATGLALTLAASCSNPASAAAPMIVERPGTVTGHAADVGVDFSSVLVAPDRVTINIDFGLKRIHAEVDYASGRIVIHSVSKNTGVPVSISIDDLARFQRVLREIPASLTTEGKHVDALGSLLSVLSEAPIGAPLDIDTGAVHPDRSSYTPICDKIGGDLSVDYTLNSKTVSSTILAGPVCYTAPALGRCGMGGGPDPVIGLVQRFTAECANHDACCAATGTRYVSNPFGLKVNICGFKGDDCRPQFVAAIPGFFLAPSCGTTEGKWTDSMGNNFVLTGGDDGGEKATSFGGKVTIAPNCSDWTVTGQRNGVAISLTARSAKGLSGACSGSFSYTGTYSDCGAAGGNYTNSAGASGSWTWTRTNVVGVNRVGLAGGAMSAAAAHQ